MQNFIYKMNQNKSSRDMNNKNTFIYLHLLKYNYTFVIKSFLSIKAVKSFKAKY